MKKSVSLLLSLLMVISIITSVPLTASAASTGDLKFKLNSDGESYYVYSCNESAEGELVIPSKYKSKPVTRIGDLVFSSCTSLTSITIPDSVTSIGWDAFEDCESLEAVYIKDIANWCIINFESSYSNPLYYAKNLYINGELATDIVVPDNVTSISYAAFYNCTSLKSITIPKRVTSIGDNAFYNCTGLKSITVDSANKKYSSVDGVLFNKKKTTLIQYPAGKRNSTYTVPDNVIKIGDDAFLGCTNLNSIKITDCVTKIGDYAFKNCENLTTITIPDSVTSIGERAFFNTALYNNEANWEDGVLYIGNHLIAASKYVEAYYDYIGNVSGDYTIKNGTKTISTDAFYGCASLTSVAIPDSVTTIGSNAFKGCTSLTSVTIPDNVTSIGSFAFYNCKNLISITIPDSVTGFGSYAFKGCTNLTTAQIGKGVTKIAKSAFENCKNLDSITIPDSVTSIGQDAFRNCTGLTRITFSDSVTTIGQYAFSNCDGLKSITIPDSVTNIEWGAFYGCSSLKKITIPDIPISISSEAFTYTPHQQLYVQSDYYYVGNHLISARVRNVEIKPGTVTIAEGACQNVISVTIPDSVILIGDYAFSQNDRLKSITIPDSVTSIGEKAFYKCTSLKSIKIPDSVKSIGKNAFEGCTSLKSATISNGVTNIASSVFSGCTSLTSITIPDSVTSIGEKAFYKCTSLKSIKIPGSVKSIASTAFKGCSALTIKCPVNSYAHKFATKNDIKCEIDCKHEATKWVTAKKATVYKAGEKQKKCTECGKVVKTKKISQLKCSKPTLKKIANTRSGVKITWGKVKGGDSYNIYRKTKNGSYSKIGSTKNNYYTDKKAKSGKRYYYIVKAVNEAGNSASSNSKSILHLADPTLKTPSSAKSGISLKWSKVAGAQGYMVYRKTGSGSYTKLKTEKGVSNLSYTDKSAKKGKKYTYKVKAYKSKTYSAYSNTKAITDKY